MKERLLTQTQREGARVKRTRVRYSILLSVLASFLFQLLYLRMETLKGSAWFFGHWRNTDGTRSKGSRHRTHKGHEERMGLAVHCCFTGLSHRDCSTCSSLNTRKEGRNEGSPPQPHPTPPISANSFFYSPSRNAHCCDYIDSG